MHWPSLLLLFFSSDTQLCVHAAGSGGCQEALAVCVEWEAAELLKDPEAMNARLRSEWGGFGIMAQSQAIFDWCRGNPLLLFPLPEGDNAFALHMWLGWDAGAVSRQNASPRKVRLRDTEQYPPQSWEALIYLHFFVSQSVKSLQTRLRWRNKKIKLWANYSDFTVSLLALISRVILALRREG